MQPLPKARAKLYTAALLALLAFICYWNSLRASFHYDDYPIILDIDWRTPHYLLHALRYQPQRFMVFCSIWLNCALGGYNPIGYHIFNVVVHALNSILVFLVASKLLKLDSKKRYDAPSISIQFAAFATGALFAVNTALTQSVSYIQGRSSSLCTLFYLIAFYCYAASAENDIDAEPPANGTATRTKFFGPLLRKAKGERSKAKGEKQKKERDFFAPLAMTKAARALLLRLTATWRGQMLLRNTPPPPPLIKGGRGDFSSKLLKYLSYTTTLAQRGRLLLAIIAFVFSCMTKEVGVTLVAALAMFEFIYVMKCKLRTLGFNTAVRLLPFAFILGLVFVSRVILYGAIGEVRAIREFWPNMFTQVSVNVTYLRMLIVPIGLSIEHDYPLYQSLFEPHVIASAALLCGLLAAAIALIRRFRMFAFGLFWFLIALLPTTLVPIWDVISEHWLYLPSVGYFLAVGALIDKLLTYRDTTVRERRLVTGILLALVFLYGSATIARNTVWRTGYSLWSDAVRKAPGKARPRMNLAKFLGESGDLEGAAEELKMALSIDPYSYEAHTNLGTIYLRKREYDRAVEQFKLALAVFPDPFNATPMEVMNVARAFYNMGLAYQQKGILNSAIDAYEKAIRVAPGMGEAYSNMGSVYMAMGRYPEAETSFRKALSVNPSLRFAGKNLELLEEQKRKSEVGEAPAS